MPDAPATRSETISLLRAAINRTGLSASAYARAVLIRDPRTVRRWLSGESPIPQAVLDLITARSQASQGAGQLPPLAGMD
ncbi:MAG TPA: hypothetical protein DDX89_02285 [Candidatus Omnitrophica bacterium]|nr:hypothetical protein [Candidatus Omnitrophota bacterium]HBH96606.1 hypothetical protein [Candidatus Omnitrophota bacterium]